MSQHGASPLWQALRAERLQTERGLARADQVVAGVGAIIAVISAATLTPALGVPLMALSLLALGWFSLARWLLFQERPLSWLGWALPASEVALPGVALVVIVLAQGPAYALGSWVPPQLFSVFIAVQVLRLRPALPLVIAALAAAWYGLVYVLAIHGKVPEGELLFRPSVQLTRCVALLLTGAACSAAVVALRRSISRASAEVRARDLFGKYVLGPDIASGGMGRVVRATYCPEGGFERQVAVKLIHPHLAQHAGFVEDFRREAALAARLAHPNIVAALDFGVVDEQWFFAMEFVDGPTLKDVLARGEPLSARLVAGIGMQILEGLHFAHAVAVDAQGQPLRVVHRDLSPANILLDRSGLVKISDFGVARALGAAAELHTRTAAGKPAYMAPEGPAGLPVDERSDLFSLGVMLWELLANQRLFLRDNELATLKAVEQAPIPALPPEHQAFEVLLLQLLSRDPAMRPGSAAQAAAELAMVCEAAEPGELAELVAVWVRAPELEIE